MSCLHQTQDNHHDLQREARYRRCHPKKLRQLQQPPPHLKFCAMAEPVPHQKAQRVQLSLNAKSNFARSHILLERPLAAKVVD